MCACHKSHVCDSGSTGWQPADWVCCFVDHHEPTDSQTERKPDCPVCALPETNIINTEISHRHAKSLIIIIIIHIYLIVLTYNGMKILVLNVEISNPEI